MDGFDRIYDLHKILQSRKTAIPLKDILAEMECSRATFNRIKRHMSDFLGAPIEYSRERGGYLYGDGHYELPGTWFNEQELHAMVVMHALLENTGNGLLTEQLAPIKARFEQLLKASSVNAATLSEKIVVVNAITRPVKHRFFVKLASALFNEKTLAIEYLGRIDGNVSKRVISPLRLVLYRGNWYLDCWCHWRNALRTFALENIQCCSQADAPFHAVNASTLDQHVKPTYGIYAGQANERAVLKFTAASAAQVMAEQWHPEQHIEKSDDGSLCLSLPYDAALPTELVADILSYGAQVEVVAPESLRAHVVQALRATLARY